jgi:hypothetical protein
MSREMASDVVSYFMAGRKIAAGEDFFAVIAFYLMPLNCILAQACELALKSNLTGGGWIWKRCNHIRHDLFELAKVVASEGVTLDVEFLRYRKMMGKPHKEFDSDWRPEHRDGGKNSNVLSLV